MPTVWFSWLRCGAPPHHHSRHFVVESYHLLYDAVWPTLVEMKQLERWNRAAWIWVSSSRTSHMIHVWQELYLVSHYFDLLLISTLIWKALCSTSTKHDPSSCLSVLCEETVQFSDWVCSSTTTIHISRETQAPLCTHLWQTGCTQRLWVHDVFDGCHLTEHQWSFLIRPTTPIPVKLGRFVKQEN